MITSHVVLRLSSQGKEVRRTRREESSAYGQPKNGYCEFVKFYAHFIVCKRLTPSISIIIGLADIYPTVEALVSHFDPLLFFRQYVRRFPEKILLW